MFGLPVFLFFTMMAKSKAFSATNALIYINLIRS